MSKDKNKELTNYLEEETITLLTIYIQNDTLWFAIPRLSSTC